MAWWRGSRAGRPKAYAVEFLHDATEGEQRDQVRTLLNMLRPYGSEFQTDIPASTEASPAVVAARAILRSLESTKAEYEGPTGSTSVGSTDQS